MAEKPVFYPTKKKRAPKKAPKNDVVHLPKRGDNPFPLVKKTIKTMGPVRF